MGRTRNRRRCGTPPGGSARHVRWARTEGIRRLIEEDRLDPVERIGTAAGQAPLAPRHGVTPARRRAGLSRGPATVRHQHAGARPGRGARDRGPQRERPDGVPPLPAARADDVLRRDPAQPARDRPGQADLRQSPGGRAARPARVAPGRALWAWRDVDDRARSEVAKFGDANLRALRAIADGNIGDAAGRASGSTPAAGRADPSFDYDPDAMDPAHGGGAVLVRPQRPVLPPRPRSPGRTCCSASYDALVADPEAALPAGLRLPRLPVPPGAVGPRRARTSPPAPGSTIDPRVRALAWMTRRLETVRH